MLKFVVISETDIFGAKEEKGRRKSITKDGRSKDFSELKPGDYVVHENHGLGIYQGIEKVEVDKVIRGLYEDLLCKGGNPVCSGNAAGSDPEICRRGCKKAETE